MMIPRLIKQTKINARKRRGDVTNVAYMTDYSPSYVSRVLNGSRFNQMILNTAYRMVYRRKKNSEL